MAGDVNRSTAEAAQPAKPAGVTLPAQQPSRAERARRSAYRGRFAAFYAVLAAIAGLAVVAAVVLIGRGGPAPAPAWSEWEPSGNAEGRVVQIGERISGQYRLPSGRGLAPAIYAGPPMLTLQEGSFRISAIAIDSTGSATSEEEVNAFPAGSTVMYTLCGLSDNCVVGERSPVAEREALLRREALELALFTFKYVGAGAESVLVQLPPRADGSTALALFLERSDVAPELSRQVSETLTAPLTPGIGEIPPDELQTLERITRPRLYEYTYIQAQNGSPVMVLAPAPVS